MRELRLASSSDQMPPALGGEGLESLTGEDIAGIWSDALGRAIRYGGDDLGALEQRLNPMLPAWYALDLCLMFSRYQTDGAAATADDIVHLTKLLGRGRGTVEGVYGLDCQDQAALVRVFWTRSQEEPHDDHHHYRL
jgi:hypothetical protein